MKSVGVPHSKWKQTNMNARDIASSVEVLLCATGICLLFDRLGFSASNIIMVYIVGVLFTAILTNWQGYSILSSIVSVLLFNFFFIEPRYTLLAFEKEYPLTFFVMLLVAFIASSLTVKLKKHAREAAQAAYRMQILFDTNRLLERVKNQTEIVSLTAKQLGKLLNRNLIIYLCQNGELGKVNVFMADDSVPVDIYTSEYEKKAASWVLHNNKHGGATTDHMPDAKCMYLTIRVNEIVYGVIGIAIEKTRLEDFEESVLLSILGECAFALENEQTRREKEEATAMAIKEQLRANLLRSISHDLRTPLTSISGNASNLISNGEELDQKTKVKLYTDIYDNSMWLINLVENLLAVTKIEEGKMNIRMTPELIEDVLNEALHHMQRMNQNHEIHVKYPDELLMAKMDAKLIIQVIINLIDNATKYTPDGSHIWIMSKKQADRILISVKDEGLGISEDEKKYIFDMFYTGAQKVADGRRSVGFGLFLCKAIIEAHGGTITVSDNHPHGSIFTFSLEAYQPRMEEYNVNGELYDE